MIPVAIKNIVAGLSRDFPINLFLVSRSGKIRWANEAMLKASGASDLKELKGKHARIFGEKEWLTTYKVIESNQEEILYETHQDKNFIVVKTPYSKEGFRGVLGFSMDITQLEQAKQAKREFILNMSHDFRTAFSGVLGVFELLLAEEKQIEKREWLRAGLLSSQRVLHFIADIQEISQATHLSLASEIFDINAMAEEVCLLLKAAIQSKGLKLIKQCEGELIQSSPFRIKGILMNLLGNAVKFTEQGEIVLVIRVINSTLSICVSDTGIGMDEKYHQKIFEECFKIRPSCNNGDYTGIGKGLYLVKQYVEALHGTIALRSEAGKGSSFTVAIPLEKVSTQAKEVIH